MDHKHASGSSLGRLALKRVAVPVAASAPRVRTLVAIEAAPVREAIERLLPRARYEVASHDHGDAAFDAYQANGCDLALISRDLPGLSGGVLSELIRKSRKGRGVAIVLLSDAYRDVRLPAGEINSFGADAFCPLPASPELFSDRVEQALARREPVERLNVLPVALARVLDDLYDRQDSLNYFELLGADEAATDADIKRAYHARALTVHPDRHGRLRQAHPYAYERINAVFRRVSEAYKVLSSDARRRAYLLHLRKHGTLRLNAEVDPTREQRELSLCQLEASRAHVLESLELRALGDLEGALEPMIHACGAEPENEDLARIRDAIAKLVHIIERSRTA